LNKNFYDGERRSHLTKPKQEHPLNDLGFDFRPILLCHETHCEVILLLHLSAISRLSAIALAFGASILAASKILKIFVVLMNYFK
jgi:hypothetical protein